MAVATSWQVYPESTNILQAHIFCLHAFLPSLGKTRPEPVQPFRSMCDSASVRNSHPMVQSMTSGRHVSDIYYSLLSLGQTILRTFYQLPRGPSGLKPRHSVVFRSRKPSVVGFSSFPVFPPSPSSFSLGSLPERSTLKLLLCTNVILLFSH